MGAMPEDVKSLQERISQLELKVKKLRLSRRILMNLLADRTMEAGERLTQLEKSNSILIKHNRNYRQTLTRLEAENRDLQVLLGSGQERSF